VEAGLMGNSMLTNTSPVIELAKIFDINLIGNRFFLGINSFDI
jgi:hypothetical protein